MMHGGRLIIKLSVVAVIIIVAVVVVVVIVVVVVVVIVVVVINWLTMFGQGDMGMEDSGERMRQCWSL